jgi:lipid-binding SYLF domain-containing protein
MNVPIRLAILASALLLAVPAAQAQSGKQKNDQAAASKLTPAEKEAGRHATLKQSAEALEKLYKIQPDARKGIETSAGYAVFDITSIYAILFVGQKGKGVLVDNHSKKNTFMTSARMGTGPGAGKQRVFQIFVFKSKGAMDQFVLTGGLGGDVTATVSTGTDGAVRSFNPSIDIYQIPESGMAVQASWGATVYAVDTELN